MAQSSGPIATGTSTERQLTDVMWRDMFGDESGVIGDLNGSAYAITLPGGTDTAQIGSTTQISTAKVAGFSHRIPLNSPEPITIPVASGSARTDIIALRYDPAYTGSPGPVRLVRIAGTSTSTPVYDDAPPGIEDLPLWAVTRTPGQALSTATVKRIFPRLAPTLTIPTDAPLPLSSPLGTVVRQGLGRFQRQISPTSGLPEWSREGTRTYPAVRTYGTGAPNPRATAWTDTGNCVSIPIPYSDAQFEVQATRQFYVDGTTYQAHDFTLIFSGATVLWTDATGNISNNGAAGFYDRETVTYLVKCTGAVGSSMTAKARVDVSTGSPREVTMGVRTLARLVVS